MAYPEDACIRLILLDPAVGNKSYPGQSSEPASKAHLLQFEEWI